MEELIAKILSKGADISTRNALKGILDLLGIEKNLVDQLYVATVDTACRSGWEKTPAKKRAVFLPQCIRNSKLCKAELTEKGYVCKNCGNCPVPEITEYAKNLGYEHVYVVPGGSMVYRILKENKDVRAALGVACLSELCEAIEKLYPLGFKVQAVQLLRAGCVDTAVDVEEVKKKLKAGLK